MGQRTPWMILCSLIGALLLGAEPRHTGAEPPRVILGTPILEGLPREPLPTDPVYRVTLLPAIAAEDAPSPRPAESLPPPSDESDDLLGDFDADAAAQEKRSPQPKPAKSKSQDTSASDKGANDEDPHARLFEQNLYPSAKECRTCHEQIYEEWSVSSHAYAGVSPMFHAFEQTINDLTKGTIGYFCMRCHLPIATALCDSRDQPLWDAIPAAREGVTCIVCHRVREHYDRVNGERRIEPGDAFAPVYGAGDGAGLADVLAKKDHYKVKLAESDKGPGQKIHGRVIQFEQLSSSHFCVSCHQVAVQPGIKLEVVWEQYRASPACKKGISCQDCHMGTVPGKACGYDTGPAAIVNDKPINPTRKRSNHSFFGPGYSIAHPGVFPFNPKADRWTMQEWLQFDYRAGWGTKAYEDGLRRQKTKCNFPQVWAEPDDRLDAREILDANLAKLAHKDRIRKAVMENSSRVDGPFFDHSPQRGRSLRLHYVVTNLNEGHNLPTGSLGAQPQLWMNVSLTDPSGCRVWESGYVDGNGDMADLHSLEVAAGHIPHDDQLFNLQTKFLITTTNGTDREIYLPINVDIDQLPFIRPSGLPITVLNHPPLIRMEAHSLSPLGSRKAAYRIPGERLQAPGRYRLSVRMRSRLEPIYFMRFCRSTPEMERAMNEGILDFHEYATEFDVP